MATIVDNPEDNEEKTTNELLMDNEAEVSETVEAQEVVEQEADDGLPEKYQGKSAAEIARMHSELEKHLGEQSREVGELRKAFDDMIRNQMTQAASAPEVPVDDFDETEFFTNPSAAVQRLLQNNPDLKELRQFKAEAQKARNLAELQRQHPDYREVATNPDFKAWVDKSPVRKQMYEAADREYRHDLAAELIGTYKEMKSTVASAAQLEKVAQKQSVKNASTGSTRSTDTGAKPRKTYKRSDIRELMIRDPKRYQAMLPELAEAYAEGRVK